MKYIIHKSNSRGGANHGWLNAKHTFSFANYQDPARMHFGKLRVLNDDIIAPMTGFDTHPHENMEIITIPLEGELTHKDSMGYSETIRRGDIQVMSAGTGIYHSEHNLHLDNELKLLQIWIFPNVKNVEPRYDTVKFNEFTFHNKLQQLVSPNKDDEGSWIYQDAWFHLGKYDEGKTIDYTLKKNGNGLYLFIISGSMKMGSVELESRDGMGILETNSISMEATTDCEVLLMEIPV